MSIVEIHEAATRLPELVKRAAAGEEILLSEGGKTVARIVAEPRSDAEDFKDWLLNGPSLESLDLERDRSPTREVDL